MYPVGKIHMNSTSATEVTRIFIAAGLIACTLFPFAAQSQQSGRAEIYFRNDNFSLQSESQILLDSLAKVLKKSNSCYLKIEGHTDSRGAAKPNDILSKNRAETVAGYFEEKGIAKDSIKTEWWGMRKPKYTGKSDTLNRRAEISYILYNTSRPVVQKKPEPEKKTEPKPKPAKDSDSLTVQRIADAGVGETVVMKSVQFYGGTPTLLPNAFPVLDELVKMLESHPAMEIAIEGHICCFNSDEDNLSGQRAKTVYDYLVNHSIEKSRLTHKGFGHTRPLTQERTAEEQQQNRRVEIRITKKE